VTAPLTVQGRHQVSLFVIHWGDMGLARELLGPPIGGISVEAIYGGSSLIAVMEHKQLDQYGDWNWNESTHTVLIQGLSLALRRCNSYDQSLVQNLVQ
jgi:hypothetical protein